MPAETDADRAAFTDPDEFGALATYTALAGATADIAGQFDNPSIAVFAGEITNADRRPTFFCPSAALPAGAAGDAGDTCTIGGVTYRVADLAPDGSGFTLITLAKGP